MYMIYIIIYGELSSVLQVIPQLELKVYFTAIIIIHNCIDDCDEYRRDGRRKHTWN